MLSLVAFLLDVVCSVGPLYVFRTLDGLAIGIVEGAENEPASC